MKELTHLKPEVAVAVGEGLRLANAEGFAILVYETLRSEERQAELYAKGRTAPGKIVTNAKPWYSWHQFGQAIDAVPHEFFIEDRDRIKHKLDWTPFKDPQSQATFLNTGSLDLLDDRWAVMVRSFESAGLEWAGRWDTFREYVHFQMRLGKTLQGLRQEQGIKDV
jgi:peptidoglycan L-alanyl-D-glutamate endopeptidase CwlK